MQAIPASPGANVFGYTLSGGADIDNNGYPGLYIYFISLDDVIFCLLLSDLTVGDLSGTVTTIRASPLVTVAMEFDNLQSTLDLVSDRKCTVSNDITLLWYDIIVNSQKFDGSVF